MEQHPLCLYLPRHAQLPAPAPSFVEACIGSSQATPGLAAIEQAHGLLARLVASGSVVPLNLFGGVGEQADFLAHRLALPFVLALRGDSDWKHAPEKSSGHKVSPLVLELWKALDQDGALTAIEAREKLGRELTEAAVLRGLSELWQGLRVSPVLEDAGQPARWELLRVRHREALTTAGATGQVTALSLLVSMYLQSVYAASGEEIEIFLSPVASRSRIREAVRGLSATRQIHSLSMDAQTYYFLENGLPEFAEAAAPEVGRVELPRRPSAAAGSRPVVRPGARPGPRPVPGLGEAPAVLPVRPASAPRTAPAARMFAPRTKPGEKKREWTPRPAAGGDRASARPGPRSEQRPASRSGAWSKDQKRARPATGAGPGESPAGRRTTGESGDRPIRFPQKPRFERASGSGPVGAGREKFAGSGPRGGRGPGGPGRGASFRGPQRPRPAAEGGVDRPVPSHISQKTRDMGHPAAGEGRPSGRPPGAFRSGSRPSGPRPGGGKFSAPRSGGERPASARPSSGARPSSFRPSGPRPGGGKFSGPRAGGERPASARPPSGARPSSFRPSGPRPGGGKFSGSKAGGERSASPRPSSGARPGSFRPSGPRPGGGKFSGPRAGGERSASPRPSSGARPSSSRPSGPRPGGGKFSAPSAGGERPASARPTSAGRPSSSRPGGPGRGGPAKSWPRAGASPKRPGSKSGKPPANFRGRKPDRKKPGV
jgi:23S rRNA pseudouridine2605 synthase